VVVAEAPRPSVAPFNLGHCVGRGISVARPLLEQRDQHVEVEAPARPVIVWGDELMIRRVMLNLLSNAAKYAPSGDHIEVRVTPRARRVVVEVCDHGPGIATPERELIFEPGVRGVTAGLDETQGSGLGLSIVKSLVELHHGNVGVRRDSNGGTAFWFTLPRRRAGRR
jgi:signal transduction histidine kinase